MADDAVVVVENNKSEEVMAEEEEEEEPPLAEVIIERDGLEEGEIVVVDPTEESAVGDPPSQHHALENSWTFWFDNPSAKSKQVAWGSSIRPIFTFSTVEDFWSLYNNIHHPSKLSVGADLYCFKCKIEPKWEDPICSNGGKWTISSPKGKADTWWLYTLLAMIGEQFEYGDVICGAVVNVRAKQEKISIWTKDGLNEAVQVSIGRQWKDFLDYNGNIAFILHDDAKKHDRFAKSLYQV